MPAMSDYLSGSITLTNGQTAFTGAGTAWLLAGFKEGDTILDVAGASGRVGVIASITSNTAGTLSKAWEGPTLTNVAYRMRYQPDGARVSAQARNLIELLGSGNLQADAALTGAANKLAYFTGPAAKALTDLTAKARAILSKSTNADILTEIGAQPAGSYLTDVPATLTPDKAFRRGNVLGTVSQSGSVPTGALIETGSNANGQYTRFADGTQICWGTKASSGSGWKGSGISATFPAAFGAVPVVQITGNPGDPGYAGIAEARYPSTTAFLIVPPIGITDSGTSALFGWLALGRWF